MNMGLRRGNPELVGTPRSRTPLPFHPCVAQLILILALAGTLGAAVLAQEMPPHAWLVASAGGLGELLETPAVSGYEKPLAEKIQAQIAAFHPVADNLGDIVITIGSGAPHRLLIAPIDEPGFAVSEITPDGYLRLQRIPQSGLPPIFNELYSAQPVKVGTASGKWIDGVVAGLSIHLQNGRANPPKSSDIDNLYVDIGANSAAEVRAAGVDVLSPVAIDRRSYRLGDAMMAGASIGDKFGAYALLQLLAGINSAEVKGTLTVAFVVQQWSGARGLQRVLSTIHPDEMIYVGRLLAGGGVPGIQGMHRAPRQELGSGVLLGLSETNGTLSGFARDLKQLADADHIPLVPDYSAALIPASYLPAPDLPAHSVHLGIPIAWPDTPIETIDGDDERAMVALLGDYLAATNSPPPEGRSLSGSGESASKAMHHPRTNAQLVQDLVISYGASNHEGPVRDQVKSLLPDWTKPETDDAGNLIVRAGAASAGSKTPKILFVAHLDEIGFEVKAISADGRLEVGELGGMELSFYEGHPALVHTPDGDRDAVMELPNGWDEPNFQWPSGSEHAIRVDVGARNLGEVEKLGIKVGDSITIEKKYRPLLGTRASARSFDDRVGDTVLISALWALGGPLKDRDVTFAFSVGEELGLDGAQALAKRLATEGREPDYVFAVDTFVSSDSPLESSRYADAPIGKGFVVRAIDNSNIVPIELTQRVLQLARANHIPAQYGVTGGGNDGSAFVPYGSVDIALGWPLRYSHSPGELIDTRDVDSLARIVAAIAKSW
jgi:putative aminopeptidase